MGREDTLLQGEVIANVCHLGNRWILGWEELQAGGGNAEGEVFP